ncbi:MAG: DUF4446 family protein [Patescibacteria group bacterium]|nr:DUF4446 family protein [Patescibacteria group bacterium]
MDDAIITVIAVTIPIIICVILGIRLLRLERKIDTITSGTSSKSLESIVKKYIITLDRCSDNLETVNNEFKVIRKETSKFLRKIGIVRFQAFKDTGGDQSFALAILDENDNGFVISSLYGRGFSKIYAKEIINGKSENYKLTEEESSALTKAIKS